MVASIFWLAGCEKKVVSEPKKISRSKVSSIRIVPQEVRLFKGQSFQLNVSLGDVSGNILPVKKNGARYMDNSEIKDMTTIADKKGRAGRPVVWTSLQPDLIEIDQEGKVLALGIGTADVVAESEGCKGRVSITISDSNTSDDFDIAPVAARITVGDSLLLVPMSDAKQAAYSVQSKTTDALPVSVDDNGLVQALLPGRVSVRATHGDKAAVVDLDVVRSERIYGLDFLGNSGVKRTLRFEFREPFNAFPATYIWRAYPRQQQGYYTAFFWGNNGPIDPSRTYYGFHPYPDWTSSSQQFWEIAAGGGDHVSHEHVVYNRWYFQVALCRVVNEKALYDYYWDWPDRSRVIRYEHEKVNDPPNPVLVVGDALWNPGNEVWNGLLRGFQFYDSALSLDDVAHEINSPGSVRNPWYLNLNPTPDDISDKSGNGHHPVWVGTERPMLWEGIVNDGIITHDFVHTPFNRKK